MTENNLEKNGKTVTSQLHKRRKLLALQNRNKSQHSTFCDTRYSSLTERNEVNLEEFFQVSELVGKPVQEETKNFTSKDSDRYDPNKYSLMVYNTNNKIWSDLYISYISVLKEKEKVNLSASKHFENLNMEIDYVESFLNYQGNYHNYVSKTLKSLIPIRKLNFSDILKEKKINFTEFENFSKKILILDLDETLIHSDFDGEFNEHDGVITFHYEGDQITVPIIIRPGLFKFLENISEIFEVFVFTASKREYADAVLNYLDPYGAIFKKRFYREDCINIKNKIFIKDLRIFNNCKLEKMVVVDNSLYSFANQLSNGVLINSFYNDKQDRELFTLFNYLHHYISNSSDLRLINEKIFNFNLIYEEYVNNPFL